MIVMKIKLFLKIVDDVQILSKNLRNFTYRL